MNILILLLIWSNLVAICMAGCAIQPDSDGHVTIPSTWTSIPGDTYPYNDAAFYNCQSLKSVTIPDSVTSIGDGAFYECSALQSVTIGDSVTSIGNSAFKSCRALQSVTIGDSVTSIGSMAFYECYELQYVTIGDSLTSIGSSAYRDCKALQSITIPDSVTSIGNYAFRGCRALQSVTIGSSESISISDYIFKSCYSLTSITFKTINEVNIDTGAFQHCDNLEYLYFNKSMTTLSGSLPVQFAPNYYCSNGICGCSKGCGNVHENTSTLYRCMPCREGKTSGGRVGQCENCDVGSYANQTASQTCTLCPKGRYGIMEGGTFEDMACKNCSVALEKVCILHGK